MHPGKAEPGSGRVGGGERGRGNVWKCRQEKDRRGGMEKEGENGRGGEEEGGEGKREEVGGKGKGRKKEVKEERERGGGRGKREGGKGRRGREEREGGRGRGKREGIAFSQVGEPTWLLRVGGSGCGALRVGVSLSTALTEEPHSTPFGPMLISRQMPTAALSSLFLQQRK